VITAAGSRLAVIALDAEALADAARTRTCAERLAATQEDGHQVVAVLAAMRGATEELTRLAHDVSPRPLPRELDLLVTTAARISCALMAMALIDLGRRAVSLTGSQAGIVTDGEHGSATILDVRPHRIERELLVGAIVLVAGHQGVSTTAEVTALRSSDASATAIALAAALGAARCELVAGDPHAVAVPLAVAGDGARRLQQAV
jgi:aspartate kinase